MFVQVRGGIYPGFCGAGDRDRTGMVSLEGWGSTIELHPHAPHSAVGYYPSLSGFEDTVSIREVASFRYSQSAHPKMGRGLLALDMGRPI